MTFSHAWKKMFSKKSLNALEAEESEFKRCLTIFDLTFIGVGSTIGAGLYIIIGQIIHNKAGPSTLLSFLLSGFASLISALCYAELAGRFPRSGSAFLFTYVSVNHVTSFIVGWTIILEYCIGNASIGRAISAYVDSLSGNICSNFFRYYMPLHISMLAEYPDFLALLFILTITILLCFGIRESVTLNNIFTFINFCVVLFVVVCGFGYSNINNWDIPKTKIPPGKGAGGFFPYGISGTMAGAATAFFAYGGFDVIVTTSDEAKDPSRSIPRSILFCITIVISVYSIFSCALTLILPYYSIDLKTPIRSAFVYIGYPQVNVFIDIGTISAMMASLLGSMIAAPRFLYSLAQEYMVFHFISRVSTRFNTAYVATMICAFISGTMSLLFNLESLVDMLSIGTLLSYTIVSVCVLFLRYDLDQANFFEWPTKTLTEKTKQKSNIMIFLSLFFCTALSFILRFGIHKLLAFTWWIWLLLSISIIGLICSISVLYFLPHFKKSKFFLAPFIPILPLLTFFINFYLMINLGKETWIRFFAWLGIGSLIYFGYAVRMDENRYESL